MEDKATSYIVFLVMFVIVYGNFMQYYGHQIKVLSPSPTSFVKNYGNAELRIIRGMCNKDPRLKILPTSTILRIRSLKIQKRKKVGPGECCYGRRA